MTSTLIDTIVETLTGRTRVTVDETYRAIHVDRGEVVDILTPGTYRLPSRKDRLALDWHEISDMIFLSEYEQAVFEKLPEVAAEQLIVFTTGENEMAVIERDGRIFTVMKPDTRLVVWADMGPWDITTIDIADDPAVEAKLARRLNRAQVTDSMLNVTVDEGKTALVTIDGKLDRQLGPGVYGFWKSGRQIETKLVDLRHQTLDVMGQELLTKDRVTIRVNIAANYRVTDPVKAVSAVKDFTEVLYRTLQTVFRKALGAKTLDQILENKATVDGEALKLVKAELAAIGVEVSDLTLKDVILPGEMRDILNTVVAAQKQAEASVIKRREETNATRSLLNTAKVIADNPIMLRLKELEALEVIAGKVDKLTITNGTDGLMNDIVKLRAVE